MALTVNLAKANFRTLMSRLGLLTHHESDTVFDTTYLQVQRSGYVANGTAINADADPAVVFDDMTQSILRSFSQQGLKIIAYAVLGGAAALALAEVAGIAVTTAVIIVAIVALLMFFKDVSAFIERFSTEILGRLEHLLRAF